jgi:hypothetical protein
LGWKIEFLKFGDVIEENKEFVADIEVLRVGMIIRNGFCKDTLAGEGYLKKKKQKKNKIRKKTKNEKMKGVTTYL